MNGNGNGGAWANKVLISALAALLAFLVLYFFNDTISRSKEESARIAVIEASVNEIKVELATIRVELDQEKEEREEWRQRVEDMARKR